MSILIKQVLLNQSRKDVLIEGNTFSKIADNISMNTSDLNMIDGSSFAILPAFYNMHTHAAMSLMRGYADDIELHTWLEDHIWPLEEKLTEEHVYHGSRLAILEMIKTGTVFFNDMYWHPYATARAADEMGVRADISQAFILINDTKANIEDRIKNLKEVIKHSDQYSSRVRFIISAHAIYTVPGKALKACAQLAREYDLPMQIHLSETQTEVDNSLKEFGLRPVQYLDSLGFLGPKVTAVHCVHLDDTDRKILADRKVTLAHCPASNMKLSSGSFEYQKAKAAGIRLVVATDGACSNNNLSMLEEMKLAALRAKEFSGDPTVAPAHEIYDMATVNAAQSAGLNAGVIEEGKLADCLLVDLNHPTLVPSGHLISDMVYSASPECIDTVICDGKILMQGRKVKNEKEIITGANKAYQDLIGK
jgi:5-methylthioadenosine/S-adenosylhomocysteine deaminase